MAVELNPYQPPASHDEVAPPEQGAVNLAGRWTRLGASMIDALISLAFLSPIQYALGVYDNFPKIRQLTLLETLAWSAGGFALWLLIHGHSLATRGQTAGKRLLNIQIVNVTDGRPATFSKIVLARHLPTLAVSVIPVVGGFLNLIDILFIFRGDRRCLHDLIAGTRVVDYRRES